MAKTILLIDEDAEGGQIWSEVLRQRGLEVRLASSEREVSRLRESAPPDLVVLNAHARHADALALVRTLAEQLSVPLLFFTPRRETDDLLDAYRVGADECISTPIDPRLFVAKIQAWLRHAWTINVEALDIIRRGPVELNGQQRTVLTPSGAPVRLSNLEFRVLHLLMSHYGRVVDTPVLIDHIWGDSEGDGHNMLKNVIYRLRQKIESDPSHPRYIRQTQGGYIFRTGTTGMLRLTALDPAAALPGD